MTDPELVAFLQWALPLIHLRWPGFRRVRGTVRKRLSRRLTALGISHLKDYRLHLESRPEEWALLGAMCRIPISRFYRDQAVFDLLRDEILPERALAARQADHVVRVWSAGCASGEEPYTMAILWHLHVEAAYPDVDFEIVATDLDEGMIRRARHGCYCGGSLREVPERWRADAFRQQGPLWCVRDEFRRSITFRCEDLRTSAPDGPFDLVLCRNIAFSYFDEGLQCATAERLLSRLKPDAVVVLGTHEVWPAEAGAMRSRAPCVYENANPASPTRSTKKN